MFKMRHLGFILFFLIISRLTSQMINQPNLCASSIWKTDGITFADASTIGDYPTTIVVDKDNSVYIVATNSNQIQIWTDGAMTSTRNISDNLNNPYGLALSKYGGILIDNGYVENTVEKWSMNSSSSGIIVMTVNDSCFSLFIDYNDTLYCSLTNYHQIVKASVNQTNSLPIVVAGNGSAGFESNLLNRPHGIYVDQKYQLYIADTDNDRIQLFEKNAVNGLTIVGNGSSANIILNRPTAVILDGDQNLFIADTDNHRIIRSDRIGYRCIIGCTGISGSNADQLDRPGSLSFDKQGNLFVVDQNNQRIQKFILSTNSCGPAYNQPRLCPTAIWDVNATTFADSTTVGTNVASISINVNDTIFVTSTDRNEVIIWLKYSSSPAKIISLDLNSPLSAISSITGDILIDNGLINNRIDRWTMTSVISTTEIFIDSSCFSLFIDIDDYLYCSMETQHQVRMTLMQNETNTSIVVAGTGTSGSSTTMLNGPRGIFVDNKTNLYVADCYNDRVQKYSSGSLVGQTLVGNGSSYTILISCPSGITLDYDNHLYVSDYNHHRIIASGPDGYRCIIGCSDSSGTSSNEPTNPSSISFDSNGNLYVVDKGNSRIQQFSLIINICGSWINQPEVCAAATWSTSAVTFANETDVGHQPMSIFISTNNSIYIVDNTASDVKLWFDGATSPITGFFSDLGYSFSLFVTKLGDIYVDNSYNRQRIDKWSAYTSTESIAMYVTSTCHGLFVDEHENIYCSQGDVHQIVRKLFIDDTNTTSVIAGTGLAGITNDTFNTPQGIFITSDDNLYVADSGNNRIQLFVIGESSGTTVVGYGAPNTISLTSPRTIIVDSQEYLFIADTDASRIVGSGPNGFRCIVGCTGSSGSDADQLQYPYSLSFDNKGNLYVPDAFNNRIQKFFLTVNTCGRSYSLPKFCTYPIWNANATTIANNSTVGPEPNDVFIDRNNMIYIAATGLNQVQTWSNQSTTPINTISFDLKLPNTIFTTLSGSIYVDNTVVNSRIDRWPYNTSNYTVELYSPAICYDIFLDIYENMFCSLTDSHIVIEQSFNSDVYNWTIAAGNGTNTSASNSLNRPHGIFIDTNFNLYVADCNNNRIQKFKLGSPNGTTVLSNTTLNCPIAVILDGQSNLYVIDYYNHRIIVSEKVGVRCIIGCNGNGSDVDQLFYPRSFSFDSYGSFYVADTGNNRIQKFELATNSCRMTITTTTATVIQTTGDYFIAPTCALATSIGPNCNVSVNPCDLLDPCENDGTCIQDTTTLWGYICLCQMETEGSECQYDYRICQSNTCWNNSTCLETLNDTFICTCAAGWQNQNCELLINYCKNVTCENNGICRPFLLDYKCQCISDSYSGRHCEIVSTRIKTLQIVSKSLASIAIIAMSSVALFVIIMDVLTYGFHIDLAQGERERWRHRRAIVYRQMRDKRVTSLRFFDIVEKTL